MQDQFPEYPKEFIETQKIAAEAASRLKEEFGRLVIPLPVGVDSLRGFWLSLRHRLGRELAVVVNGKRVIRGGWSYETLREAVTEEIHAPERRAAQA